jgi:hypothetical protein
MEQEAYLPNKGLPTDAREHYGAASSPLNTHFIDQPVTSNPRPMDAPRPPDLTCILYEPSLQMV